MTAAELVWKLALLDRCMTRDKLTEAFGTGTAAVISPVGTLAMEDEKITLGDGGIGPVAQKLYDTLTGIQYGRIEDKFGWIVKL